MSAGPYPTKAMHEALKTRVTTLEDAAPSGGGQPTSAPPQLSDTVIGGVKGSGAKSSLTVPITSVRISRSGGQGLSFNAFRASDISWQTVTITVNGAVVLTASAQDLVLDSSGSDPVWLLDQPYFGNTIDVLLDLPGSVELLYDQGSQVATAGFTQEILTGTDTVPQTATLQLLTHRTVLGSLAPNAMNVTATPSELKAGEFEIVSGGAAPRLRFKTAGGQIYSLEMTPET